MMKPKALTSEAIGRAKLHQVHFYWKTARDTLHFDGIASGFAMFLHWMPDQVGHDAYFRSKLTSLPA